MKLTFLGTGAATPSRTRNVSGIALQFDQRSTLWLFDCGEGTQHQILRTPISLSRLERIFITHLHGDHFFGLIGLLSSRSLQDGSDSSVTIYGPPGIEQYLRCSLAAMGGQGFRFPVSVVTVEPGLVCEDDEYRVSCTLLRHRIPSFAYVVQQKDRPGHFDPVAARASGVPEGPLFGRLKNGETIALADGRTINGRDFTGPVRHGRKVVICGDTYGLPDDADFAYHADLLVHEATYAEPDHVLARRALHSTAAMAAQAAKDAEVEALILTHISPRYDGGNGPQLHDLLAEARAIFPETWIAADLWSFTVPNPA